MGEIESKSNEPAVQTPSLSAADAKQVQQVLLTVDQVIEVVNKANKGIVLRPDPVDIKSHLNAVFVHIAGLVNADSGRQQAGNSVLSEEVKDGWRTLARTLAFLSVRQSQNRALLVNLLFVLKTLGSRLQQNRVALDVLLRSCNASQSSGSKADGDGVPDEFF